MSGRRAGAYGARFSIAIDPIETSSDGFRFIGHPSKLARSLVNPDFVAEIANFLRKEAGMNVRDPKPSIAPLMAAIIQSEGIEAAING